MNLEELTRLVAQGESDVLEYKTSLSDKVFKALCAFLNHKGGTILIGVTDDGRLVGLDVADATQREIANRLRRFEPTPPSDVYYIELPHSFKKVVVIQVPAGGADSPYAWDGRSYRRERGGAN